MLKEEFEERAGRAVTAEEFNIINEVYVFHPCISDTQGKDQIAELYIRFGMTLMLDMYPTAKKAEECYNRRLDLQVQMAQLEEEEQEYMNRRGLII